MSNSYTCPVASSTSGNLPTSFALSFPYFPEIKKLRCSIVSPAAGKPSSLLRRYAEDEILKPSNLRGDNNSVHSW
ncbi:MAG: hypothetical protein U1C58_06135 [Flavobacteriaceae bacterium]|nr:hypothetical protein [Flavobacteriaceae bacterium]